MAGLRVIAGEAKGRRLRMVPGEGTRPISDRVKEALFSILGPDIDGASFLDLFAGTGGVGIEALSRGAQRAVFVDSNPKAAATIRANLQTTHMAPRGEVVLTDVFHFLDARATETFDYLYLAPPQYRGLWEKALLAIDAEPGWVAEDGLVIAQVFPKEHRALPLSHMRLERERRYGSTLLAMYVRT